MKILEITCSQLAPFMRILSYLLKLIGFGIPIILIVLVIIDFVKATLANDEKKMKEAQNVIGKRVVYAIIIFLVPTIVSLIFKTIDRVPLDNELSGPTDWISCFKRFYW